MYYVLHYCHSHCYYHNHYLVIVIAGLLNYPGVLTTYNARAPDEVPQLVIQATTRLISEGTYVSRVAAAVHLL